MLTLHQTYDPKKMVSLKATRALFIEGRRVEIGEVFQMEAQQCGDVLATDRATFVNQNERGLVFKQVAMFR